MGVLVDSNAAFYSRPVGVFVGEGLAGGFLSKPVGVLVSSEVSYAYTPPIGTVYGPLLDSSQPAAASPGSSVDFDVNGFNLDEVLTVTVTPADDVTVGTVTVNPEGTLLTVSISIDPLAVTGTRELMLNDASGPVQTRSGTQLTFDIQ